MNDALITFRREDFLEWLRWLKECVPDTTGFNPPEEVTLKNLRPEDTQPTLTDLLIDGSVTRQEGVDMNIGPIHDNLVVRSLGLDLDGTPMGLLGLVFSSSDGRTPEVRVGYLGPVQSIIDFGTLMKSQADKTVQNLRKRGGK